MKGYNLQQPCCTSSSHSHSLSPTVTDIFYNATIQYTVILQCFPLIGELKWENTTSHPIPWVQKLLANKHPKISFGDVSLAPPSWD